MVYTTFSDLRCHLEVVENKCILDFYTTPYRYYRIYLALPLGRYGPVDEQDARYSERLGGKDAGILKLFFDARTTHFSNLSMQEEML